MVEMVDMKEMEEMKEMKEMKEAKIGEEVGFERIRRITGYLVGTMDKWNNAKKSEEKDRVKHNLGKANA